MTLLKQLSLILYLMLNSYYDHEIKLWFTHNLSLLPPVLIIYSHDLPRARENFVLFLLHKAPVRYNISAFGR
jgi:hypothetical protein